MADSPTPPSVPLSEAYPGGLRRFALPGLFVIALFIALVYRTPAGPARQMVAFKGRIFGTTYAVKVVVGRKRHKKLDQKALQQKVHKALQAVDGQMSTYNKASELSRFNKSKSTKPIKISKALAKVLQEAQRINKLSGGAFDVTIGPVINAWGFGPNKRIKPPGKEVLAKAKEKVGANKLTLDPQTPTLQKSTPDLYVDLSAIAKGYGVDVIGMTLEAEGFGDYMVEIGGEVRARGLNLLKVPWRIGVETPTSSPQRRIHQVVSLRNTSMATSGNYRNYIMVNGKRISHIIDARTSQPVSHQVASVTVLHPDCMSADALATTFFVLGPKEGIALAQKHQLAILYLVPKGNTFISIASKAFKEMTSPKAHQPPATR